MTANHAHTPTTQHVRNAYIDHRYTLAAEQGEFPPGIVERMNEFDRWLASIIAAAEQRGAVKAFRHAATAFDYLEATDQWCTWGMVAKWLRDNADKFDQESDDETH